MASLQSGVAEEEEFGRAAAAASKRLEAGREGRRAAGPGRGATPPPEGPTAEEDESRRRERRAEASRVRMLTKALIPLASIGSRDGLERALAQGADLGRAAAGGVNPAMAAILAGHGDVAMWIIGQAGHRWSDEGRVGGVYSELSAAMSADNVEVFERVSGARPGLLGKSRAHAGFYRSEGTMMDAALSGSPRVAAWLARHEPSVAAQRCRPAGGGPYPYWIDRSLALSKAIEGRLPEAAELLEFLRSDIESPSEPEGLGLVERFVRADDAASLAWVFERSPRLGLLCARGVAGGRVHKAGQHWARDPGVVGAGLAGRVRGAWAPGSAADPRVPMAIWAAGHKALECASLLLDIPVFAGQVAACQERPERWLWEVAYLQVGERAIVELLGKAGLDFSRSAPGDWSYPALFMMANKPSVKWLGMVGKEMSGLLGARGRDDKTPFDVCAAAHGEGVALKARACAEKAAIRGAAGRGGGTRAAKAKGAPRRL